MARNLPFAIFAAFTLGAFLILGHRVVELQARQAHLPTVHTIATTLPGWSFTTLRSPDGQDIAYTLDGPGLVTLPMPPRRPE